MVLFDKIHRIIYNFPGVWLKCDVKPVRWILIKFFSVSSIFLASSDLFTERASACLLRPSDSSSVGGWFPSALLPLLCHTLNGL